MLVYGKLFLASLSWGGAFVAVRFLTEESTPSVSAFLRFAFSVVFLIALSFRRTGALLPALSWRDLLALALLGFVGTFLYSMFLFTGLETVPAGRTAVIFATSPVFIAVSAALLFKEEFGPVTCFGTILSMTGAVLVISRGNLTTLFDEITTGDIFIVLAMLSWVFYSLYARHLLARLSPLVITFWSCCLGAVFLFIPAYDELFAVIASLSITSWSIFVYLSFLATVLGSIWFNEGVQAIGAGKAGIFMNFVPVSAVFLGFVLLGESLELSLIIGCMLVVLGTGIVNRKRVAS